MVINNDEGPRAASRVQRRSTPLPPWEPARGSRVMGGKQACSGPSLHAHRPGLHPRPRWVVGDTLASQSSPGTAPSASRTGGNRPGGPRQGRVGESPGGISRRDVQHMGASRTLSRPGGPRPSPPVPALHLPQLLSSSSSLSRRTPLSAPITSSAEPLPPCSHTGGPVSRGSTRGIHCGAPGSSRGVGHIAGAPCLQEKCFWWISKARTSVWTKRARASQKGARVHVKAHVIDGEFREQGELVGWLKRWAACGEP